LAELRAIEPAADRRRIVARLSALGSAARSDRVASDGRRRHRVAGRCVLYRWRVEGALVIVALRPDALD
jgi:hypothetical protein